MSKDDKIAIVIFGAAVHRGGRPSRMLTRRVQAAELAGRKMENPLYVATGGVGQFHPSEAAVMRRLLMRMHIPQERILLDETATDTLSSVRAVRRLLEENEFTGKVYVATSKFHLPRCMMLMRLAGFRPEACAPPRAAASRRFTKRWFWRLREVPAIPLDFTLALLLRLFGRL
jgi:uncharacterized SAM-binding protein YcdF (DUF218 family)